MSSSRRQFIRQVGVALAAVALARCKPPVVTCYAPALPTGMPTLASGNGSPRSRLRASWLGFGQLAEQTQASRDSEDLGEQALRLLGQDHRAALDELVAAGELEPAVADQVQAAFDAAAYHIWRSNTPITCYEPVLVDYQPTTSAQLVEQSEALSSVARDSDLDAQTIARAQAAIERDIAFLNLSDTDVQALYDGLVAAAGGGDGFPTFDEVKLDVTPEAAEAARFLVHLLLGQEE